jgi:hypothetical protein
MSDNQAPRRSRRCPRDRPTRQGDDRGPVFVVDHDFDQLLPDDLRILADLHFTPIGVARRAAQWLVDRPGARVLDVGAAVGKFCIIGAEYTDGVFVGVEHRPRLAHVATAVAGVLGLPNVTFIQCDLVDLDWTPFDGFYLYNPFVEYIPGITLPIDRTIDLQPEYFLFYVKYVRQRLSEARLGTRVVTYHGFGSPPPDGYVLKADEPCGTGRLALWVKEVGSQRRRRRHDTTIDEPSPD